jgi:hypothetical protein
MALTPSPDIYASNVVLLLPFDENLTDYSSVQKTVTVVGGAAVSAIQKKYGAQSLHLNGSTDYITSPSNTDFDFGTGDFTVEFWLFTPVAWTSQPASSSVIGKKLSDSTNGWVIYRDGGAPSKLNARIGLQNNFYTASTPTANTWEHWAVTRQGTTLRWFKNGVLDATGSSSVDISDTNALLKIGEADSWSGSYLNGYLDEIRVTKGIARYTTNFTPPQSFFTVEASFSIVTVLPILQDLFVAEFGVTTDNPIAVTTVLFATAIFAAFVVTAEIPVAQITVYFSIPVFCDFVDNTPCAKSRIQAFHPYNENSELHHTTLPYAPLIKTECNTRFIGRQV